MDAPTPDDAPHDDAPHDYDDSPIAWFADLLMAVEGGNYRLAAEAQRELRRLGWDVARYQGPRPNARTTAKTRR